MVGHGHRRPRTRSWMLLVAAAVIGLVGHLLVLYYGLSHVALPAAVMSGVIVLIVIKHFGLLGPLHALFRWSSRH